MTTERPITFLCILSLLLLSVGCRSEATNGAATEEPSAAEAPSAAVPETAAADVAYEPAYPADVSEDGLGAEDTDQQQATHAHEGEQRSHTAGEDHLHGEGDEEHDHGSDDGDEH